MQTKANPTPGKNRFPILDLSKFIMSISAIAWHTKVFVNCKSELFQKLYNAVSTLALPIFFMISGFLLFYNMNGSYATAENLAKIKKTIKRTLSLYGIWTLIYLPLTLYEFANNSNSTADNALFFLRRLVFWGEQYYSWPLWYLLSIAYGLSLIYLLLKIGMKEKFIYALSFGIFLFGCIMNALVADPGIVPGRLQGLFNDFVYYFQGGRLFTGVGYMAFSMMTARSRTSISTPLSILALVCGVGSSLVFGELFFAVCYPVLAWLFLQAALRVKLPPSPIWLWFRKISSVMYFSHMFFFFLYVLLRHNGVFHLGRGAFSASFLGSLLLAIMVLFLENKKPFRFLKKIL